MEGVEHVVKQGYLKKGTSGIARLSGLFRRLDNQKWFVFTIRQGVPFLDYYDRDVDMFTQAPINSFNLSGCVNIKCMGASNPMAFCVVCSDRVIELIASSRNQMAEWVRVIHGSLNRLGVLKRAEEHIYTVCPAVVRQPRPNNEAQEEKVAEQASSASAVTVDSQTVTMRRSVQGAAAAYHDCQAPPVPKRSTAAHKSANRSNSCVGSMSLTTNRGPEEERDSMDGSNDSHFVSAEVISEIRRSHSLRASAAVDRDHLDLNDNSSIHATHVEISSLFSNSKKSKEKQKVDTQKHDCSNDLLQFSTSSSELLQDHSTSSVNISNVADSCQALAMVSQQPGCMENEYSALPGAVPMSALSPEQDSCTEGAEVCSAEAESSNEDLVSASAHLTPKPVPRPRKAMSKTCPQDQEDPDIDTSNSSFEDVYCLPPKSVTIPCENSDETQKLCFVSGMDSVEDEDLTVHNNSIADEKEPVCCPGDSLTASNSSETQVKAAAEESSKDENENLYGLMYDAFGAPTTMAPPIPPLPRRHDSLAPATSSSIPPMPSRDHSLTVTTACQTDTRLTPATSTSASSTSPVPSSLSLCGRNSDVLVPPLPQPRRKGRISGIYKKQSSDLEERFSIAIPPMPLRHAPPKRSASIDEKPPALPVRNAQSFVIKRPQLTTAGGADGAAGLQSRQSSTLDRGATNSVAQQAPPSSVQGESSKGSSGLSRKMLLDRSHSMHTVVSLKQTQAEILQQEIGMARVTVTLTQKSGHGLALVDWEDTPCIVGWNQKDFCSLHGKLHVGDLIYSVNKVRVASSEVAYKLLKQSTEPKIEVVLHRMPFAKVYAIRRSAEGQSLGIKREGGTGEIVYVDPNGLAAQHGLVPYTNCVRTANSRCNWFLTQINNRPLNLFFKEQEIDHRLSAVGREISIVVQPSDFIFEIRKLFKKIKNYKSFIVQ